MIASGVIPLEREELVTLGTKIDDAPGGMRLSRRRAADGLLPAEVYTDLVSLRRGSALEDGRRNRDVPRKADRRFLPSGLDFAVVVVRLRVRRQMAVIQEDAWFETREIPGLK